MTLLNNPNFIGFGGDPITGRIPPRVEVYGPPMTSEQYGQVLHAYKLFYDAVNNSAFPQKYHIQHRDFSDGTRLRMTSSGGLHTVEVWPAYGSSTNPKRIKIGIALRFQTISFDAISGWNIDEAVVPDAVTNTNLPYNVPGVKQRAQATGQPEGLPNHLLFVISPTATLSANSYNNGDVKIYRTYNYFNDTIDLNIGVPGSSRKRHLVSYDSTLNQFYICGKRITLQGLGPPTPPRFNQPDKQTSFLFTLGFDLDFNWTEKDDEMNGVIFLGTYYQDGSNVGQPFQILALGVTKRLFNGARHNMFDDAWTEVYSGTFQKTWPALDRKLFFSGVVSNETGTTFQIRRRLHRVDGTCDIDIKKSPDGVFSASVSITAVPRSGVTESVESFNGTISVTTPATLSLGPVKFHDKAVNSSMTFSASPYTAGQEDPWTGAITGTFVKGSASTSRTFSESNVTIIAPQYLSSFEYPVYGPVLALGTGPGMEPTPTFRTGWTMTPQLKFTTPTSVRHELVFQDTNQNTEQWNWVWRVDVYDYPQGDSTTSENISIAVGGASWSHTFQNGDNTAVDAHFSFSRNDVYTYNWDDQHTGNMMVKLIQTEARSRSASVGNNPDTTSTTFAMRTELRRPEGTQIMHANFFALFDPPVPSGPFTASDIRRTYGPSTHLRGQGSLDYDTSTGVWKMTPFPVYDPWQGDTGAVGAPTYVPPGSASYSYNGLSTAGNYAAYRGSMGNFVSPSDTRSVNFTWNPQDALLLDEFQLLGLASLDVGTVADVFYDCRNDTYIIQTLSKARNGQINFSPAYTPLHEIVIGNKQGYTPLWPILSDWLASMNYTGGDVSDKLYALSASGAFQGQLTLKNWGLM